MPAASTVGRALKGIAVAIAVIFFVAVVAVLWAFRTGRAVELARAELLNTLVSDCSVAAQFQTIELGLLPPEIRISDVELTDLSGNHLASVEDAILSIEVLPLFYGRLQLRDVAVLAPEATLEIDDDGIANLPSCIEPPKKGSDSRTPFVLGIRQLQVERGKFLLKKPGVFTAQLDEIGVTLTPGRSGGTDLAIGVDDGRVTFGDNEAVIERFRLTGQIAGLLSNPRAITVDRLDVGIDGAGLIGTGSIDLLGPVLEARVSLDGNLNAVPKILKGAPKMLGQVHAEASITGDFVSPRAVGTIRIEDGDIDDYLLADTTTVDFDVDTERVKLRSVELRLGDGSAIGRGEILFDENFSLTLDVTVDALPLGRLIEALAFPGAWADFRGYGPITAKGTILNPTKFFGTANVVLRDFFTFDRGWDAPEITSTREPSKEYVLLSLPGATTVDGRWSADTEGIDVLGAEVARGNTSATVHGRFHFEEAKGLSLRADFSRFDFLDLGSVAQLPMGGWGGLAIQIEGPYAEMKGIGSFDLKETSVGGIPFGDGAGSLYWEDTVVRVSSIEGRIGRTSYNGDVVVDIAAGPDLSISGVIPRGRVEDVIVPFRVDPSDWGDPTGAISARFDLQGEVDRLTGPIDFELSRFQILGEKAERGRVIGRMESGAIVAEAAELHKYGARLNGSGRLDPHSGDVRARVRTIGLSLQKIDLMRQTHKGLDGALTLGLDVRGSLDGVTGTITAALKDVKAEGMTLGDSRLLGKIAGATTSVKGTLLTSKLEVDGQLLLKAGLPYQTKLRLTEFDAPRLVAELAGKGIWTGSVSGRAELAGSLIEWERSDGEIYLSRARFEAPSLKLGTAAPVSLKLDDGVFASDRISLVGPTTKLDTSGKLSTRLMDLAIHGRVDLAILENAYAQIERARGQLTLDAAVRGNAKAVDLVGTGKVQGGLLQWRGFDTRLTAGTADLTFSQATILVDNIQGRVDGGRTTGRAEILLEGLVPSRFQLETTFADVRPKYTHPKFDLTGLLNGRLYLEGRPDRLVLRGTLAAKRAVVRPKFDWRNLIGDPMQRLAPNVYDPTAESLSFDVAVHLEEPLRIRNDTADVAVTGDVTMTGTNQRLGLVGGVVVQGGRVGFLGREYTVTSGTLDMRDRFRFWPDYDLVLEAGACGAEITLNLVGDLDEVNTTYTSKPEMSDTNIVSCLVRGVKIKDLETLSNDALGGAAASFAGEALWRLSGVDRQVKKVLPIDHIDVVTEYSSRDRLYEPRLLIAKEVLDGKVRLEYSSSLFNNEDQRVAVRYRVTPDLTLQSGWTSSEDIAIGDLGLDVKYRWEW